MFTGNSRLHERLYDDSNLRHRRGENSGESYELVDSKDKMSTHKLNPTDTIDAIHVDSSSIYHQRTIPSSEEG